MLGDGGPRPIKLLALDGDLVKAEPNTLRYRVLHAAARVARRQPQALEVRRELAMDRSDHPDLATHLRPP
jgi:hypothetical protein